MCKGLFPAPFDQTAMEFAAHRSMTLLLPCCSYLVVVCCSLEYDSFANLFLLPYSNEVWSRREGPAPIMSWPEQSCQRVIRTISCEIHCSICMFGKCRDNPSRNSETRAFSDSFWPKEASSKVTSKNKWICASKLATPCSCDTLYIVVRTPNTRSTDSYIAFKVSNNKNHVEFCHRHSETLFLWA